ncbi:uncharacterized [Tachysurus ichikawai]
MRVCGHKRDIHSSQTFCRKVSPITLVLSQHQLQGEVLNHDEPETLCPVSLSCSAQMEERLEDCVVHPAH